MIMLKNDNLIDNDNDDVMHINKLLLMTYYLHVVNVILVE